MADAESISLEETNKIRISLGLAPLKPPSAGTGDSGQDNDLPADDEKLAFDNLKTLRAEQAKAAEEAALKRRLQK
jgi:U4/U6.U5 tri-snRNP-associated protein 1